MKRPSIIMAMIGILSVIGLAFSPPILAQQDPDLGISAKRYIVVDAETGEVFAERNADEEVALASLTKVFTTIEALERGNLSDRITTRASDLFDSRSTLMGFGAGETFTLEDLLYGMMLPSGNDAAHAIARALGTEPGLSDEEAVERFMDFVNERVRNMGLTHTNLLNPHGWGVEGHYSTARDIATFTMYAIKYPAFLRIVGTTQHTTADGMYTLSNTNRLLNTYPDLIGGKTGYDLDSGYCLVEIAQRNGSTMISVTLDGVAPDVWYQDNAILLDYAFSEKEKRLAADREISGPVLSYRDPDAATILAAAGADSGIGEPHAPEAEVAMTTGDDGPQQVDPAFVQESANDEASEGSGGRDLRPMIGAGAVIALIGLAVAMRSFGHARPSGDQSLPPV